eukprot:5098535-Prorocentrum_lima.AAC.1
MATGQCIVSAAGPLGGRGSVSTWCMHFGTALRVGWSRCRGATPPARAAATKDSRSQPRSGYLRAGD